MESTPQTPGAKPAGTPGEVFRAFLGLGLTSFGGPIAHLGYFRAAFVVRRNWLSDAAFADLVALCQFLPGPASSQAGFAIGLMRAGPLGALAAFAGFTLPSAIAMVLIAFSAAAFSGDLGTGLVHGLKIVAVAVVAQAVWGMARTLTPDATRAAIAVGALVCVLAIGGTAGQLGAIALGALAGLWLCRGPVAAALAQGAFGVSKTAGLVALAVFAGLLAGLPLAAALSGVPAVAQFDAFYRSGALVFGGGHVVLPLLEAATVQTGWVGEDAFLAGYGAAQAMPGPLFTFAAYLGAVGRPPLEGVAGAAIALTAIMLPGFLVLVAALPFWDRFRTLAWGQALMRGANAAVVGILAAALYDPLWTSTIARWDDAVLALATFAALTLGRAPPWTVVLAVSAAAVVLQAVR